jgi:hypothetical protein
MLKRCKAYLYIISMVIEWKDILVPSDLDRCRPDGEKVLISEMENKVSEDKRCPCLMKVGQFSYFCGAVHGLDGEMARISPKGYKQLLIEEMSPSNPLYAAQLGVPEMSLYCFGEYGTCCYRTGSLEPVLPALMEA